VAPDHKDLTIESSSIPVCAYQKLTQIKNTMYIVAIGWIYVALMMAVAEAFHPMGTVLGAIITFVLYGLGPVALVLYILGAPQRRRDAKAREGAASLPPDTSRHAAADPVTPVRKET
jgi:hypothetical protein